eukprot:TRINITY_DN4508_c0_g1_i2.p1 TRINITY_DN4508_c0_g1~~TRINITY_DN4508_c0_g1_i2.p1  ORF type:complete len:115 (+),score=32.47 TRINITY_DN4508_c0_g1_i2:2-346(+)
MEEDGQQEELEYISDEDWEKEKQRLLDEIEAAKQQFKTLEQSKKRKSVGGDLTQPKPSLLFQSSRLHHSMYDIKPNIHGSNGNNELNKRIDGHNSSINLNMNDNISPCYDFSFL